MDRNVDIIQGLRIMQVLLKVLHLRKKEIFLAFKVFVNLSVFIENVDDYFLFLLLRRSSPISENGVP